ncbi:aldo/keto reductase [Paenibacillus apiarius]|uniref:Aldo/keto reductase n=1 Tax=Paenibacillus apiarius TaxID=46240 RepID=A0ABT4E1B3_9BACL|nr:aldo/keto reductase [Paenibacillus apiarius]MBN3522977.1 aldo/keto reductase [Paenibacillus apiarius]MCY9514960.1 aldo/keto reductase [Paenibacillus apiarius]MCY9523376.1 aldo/keto reductase [Paenibacillus apiarius]MCY9554204.1 aldo/keto reductase [Paenibacillus apiarius]MCY9559386.1 aldo/keto reductase [Paenibacillus apiarius]
MLITLNNGVSMPQLGLGVWRVEEGQQIKDAVKTALDTGYRLIDTAAIYKNEAGVGEAIRESGVKREDIFLTTKVWNSDQGYDATLKAFDESLHKLGTDYIDLYLIHWPVPSQDLYVDTYKALEKLAQDGRVRAIGVSNFHIPHLERILQECTVKPAVNQVECHPRLAQNELREFCKQNDIYLEAWSPLMQGGDILTHETIASIAANHGKTPAQVVIRWHLQKGNIVIPKSITASRIKENFDVFDFQLSDDELAGINALNEDKRVGPNPDEFAVT